MLQYVAGGAVLGCLYIIIPVVMRVTIQKPSKCKSEARLDGKVAVITGANTGLGKVTALDLSRRGAHVYMACRDMEKAKLAKETIEAEVPDAKLSLLELDLSSLAAVRASAEQFLASESELNILVNNAGFANSGKHEKTGDGIEVHLGVNCLGHFVFTRMLLPLMVKSGNSNEKSRIINVSSLAHRFCMGIDYEGLDKGSRLAVSTAYGQSKLANIYFTKHLSKLIADKDWPVTVNCLHPGTCRTEFFRNFFFAAPWPWPLSYLKDFLSFPVTHLARTDVEGAQTQIYAAVAKELEGVSGIFLDNCKEGVPNQKALEQTEWKKLWLWCCDKCDMSVDL